VEGDGKESGVAWLNSMAHVKMRGREGSKVRAGGVAVLWRSVAEARVASPRHPSTSTPAGRLAESVLGK